MSDRKREHDDSTSSAADGARKPSTGPSMDRSMDPVEARLDAIKNMPDVRLDRIEAMKRAIASGEFDTPERLNAAIRRMLDELHHGE
ncbi:MAG: flagellar biosynthesis anti-sigma factor FlgM [Planctomycetota bacterium]|nr:flagellar biosynthesis anti-sigma factor FlgM [Planctomycetota bacterium]MDA1105421.1 flagellar biosynthesis anti-sigma factor FlgM [Planctomycetota bacterium]